MAFTFKRGKRGRNRLRFTIGKGRRRYSLSGKAGPFSLRGGGRRRTKSSGNTHRRRWF